MLPLGNEVKCTVTQTVSCTDKVQKEKSLCKELIIIHSPFICFIPGLYWHQRRSFCFVGVLSVITTKLQPLHYNRCVSKERFIWYLIKRIFFLEPTQNLIKPKVKMAPTCLNWKYVLIQFSLQNQVFIGLKQSWERVILNKSNLNSD